MESPGKSLSIAGISPTRVVRDRPSLCSVPSGERTQEHIIQRTIPEHFPEIEKVNYCYLFGISRIFFVSFSPFF
jgi:hypothetical protein